MERLKLSCKKFYGRFRDLNPVIWSLPLTNVKWHSDSWPSYSYFQTDQNFQQFHDRETKLDLHRIKSGFNGAFANGYGMPAGNAYPCGHLVPPPFGNLLMLQLLRPVLPNLPCLYSNFHLEYPSVLSRFCCALPLYIITLVTAGILVTIILKLLCTNINYRCYCFTTTPFFLKLSFSQNTYYSE